MISLAMNSIMPMRAVSMPFWAWPWAEAVAVTCGVVAAISVRSPG